MCINCDQSTTNTRLSCAHKKELRAHSPKSNRFLKYGLKNKMNAHYSKTMPHKIGLMGTPISSGNRGVQALGEALARLCMKSAPNAEICLFESHRKSGSVVMRPNGNEISIPIIHWRMSPKCHPRDHIFVITLFSFIYRFIPLKLVRKWIARSIPWIKALETTDLIGDVRGGDSFSDIYGIQRLIVATLPVMSVIFVKRKIVLFPQTYGPFKSRTARWVARWTVKHASFVVARDKESQRIAQELAGTHKKVLLSPDVAFALHADSVEQALFDYNDTPEPVPKNAIGLNINGLMFNGGYTEKNMFGLKMDYRSFAAELLVKLLGLHTGPIILIPHTYAPAGNIESDNEACRIIKQGLPPALQSRVKIVTGDYDAHQLKGIIKQCVFFIGSRMHSCIAALSQDVPCIGIAYSMKFRGVFETVGSQNWIIDARKLNNDQALEQVGILYAAREEHSITLSAKTDATRKELSHIFNNIISNT